LKTPVRNLLLKILLNLKVSIVWLCLDMKTVTQMMDWMWSMVPILHLPPGSSRDLCIIKTVLPATTAPSVPDNSLEAEVGTMKESTIPTVLHTPGCPGFILRITTNMNPLLHSDKGSATLSETGMIPLSLHKGR